MPAPLSLSSGEIVHIKPFFTHKADRVFSETMRKDVVFERGDDGKIKAKQMPELNFERAVEAIIPLLIVSVEKGGNTLNPSQEWLDDLSRDDYELLYEAVKALKNDMQAKADDGEKKGG